MLYDCHRQNRFAARTSRQFCIKSESRACAAQQLNPNIPAGVGSTIMKALSKSPFLRYENCRELMDDLKNYRPGESPAKENAAASMSTMAPRPAIPKS